MSELK